MRKLGLALLILALIIRTATLPSSVGYAYGPAHFYNLYLPDLGVGIDISILPNYFKTLPATYIHLKILLEILSDPLLTYRILYVFQPVLTFSAYILFLGLVKQFKARRFILASIFALVTYWPGEQYLVGALILGMVAVSGILSHRTKLVVLGYLSFIAVSLYWHSASVLFTVFIFSFLLVRYLKKRIKRDLLNIFLVSTISTSVWVYIRGGYQRGVFESLFMSLLDIKRYFDIDYLKNALLSKGIMAPSRLVYNKYDQIGTLLTHIRYIGYVIVMFIVIYAFASTINKNKYPSNKLVDEQLALFGFSLSLGTIFHTILSLLALNVIGSITFIVFLFPYAVAYLSTATLSTATSRIKRKLYIGLLIYLLISIGISEAYSAYYVEIKTNPRFNEKFETYHIYSTWIGKHFNNGSYFVSDAATIGYISIWFGRDKLYKLVKVHFTSLDTSEYISIYTGKWNKCQFIIYNFELYVQNLPFYSLQAWNLYKPIPPEKILRNTLLDKLYDSKNIWILGRSCIR